MRAKIFSAILLLPLVSWGQVSVTGPTYRPAAVLQKSDNGVKFVTIDQSVANTNTLTDSAALQVVLAPGTYWIETLEMIGSSAYATAGAQSILTAVGGSVAWSAGRVDRVGIAAATPINGVAPTFGGPTQVINAVVTFPVQSIKVVRSGVLTVTANTTLKIQFAQSAAVAAETATLLTGSYLRYSKLD